MEEKKMILAHRIKEYRVKIGYSQEQFAQKLGVTRQTKTAYTQRWSNS